MRPTSKSVATSLFVVFAFLAPLAHARPRPVPDVLDLKADAVVDLRTVEGARLAQATWRYRDVRVAETDFRSSGPDWKPSGAPIRTLDIAPKVGAPDFDDSSWETLDPTTLEARRSSGKLAFAWYRLQVTIPETIGKVSTTGATIVFEIVLDDYAEIWVNGALPRILGTAGGQLVGGFNAPNRVVLTRDARPGQKFQIAVFGANGPLSDPPSNYVWIRSATLDVYAASRLSEAKTWVGEVVRLDPAVDAIVPPGAKLEKLAEGFQFIEGPVWHPDGYLLFSEPNNNKIYRYTPDGDLSVFRSKSGYTGTDIGEYGQPGSNGLALDGEGRLTICEHGNHRVTRLEKNGRLTVLADRYLGKRLNSPNDLVYRSDGSLYFTDPPFGLPRFFDDPRKELPFSGVFRYADGKLQLLTRELTGPNGLAFSPDERFLYVDNWDAKKKVVMRYPVRSDGTLGDGAVFFDMKDAPEEEALDGLKVDRAGNLFVSGPGGVWILSAEGKHLGTIKGPELPANFAWGDADGRTLYMTARSGLYRLRLSGAGSQP